MNSPLKFRCWDNKSKRFRDQIPVCEAWIDSDCWDDPEDYMEDGLICCPAHPLPDFNGRMVYEQWTGLVDLDGKEIFEGDVYTLHGYSNNPYYCVWYDGAWWNRRVGQSEEDFIADHVKVSPDSQHCLRSHVNLITVIGNIHELS